MVGVHANVSRAENGSMSQTEKIYRYRIFSVVACPSISITESERSIILMLVGNVEHAVLFQVGRAGGHANSRNAPTTPATGILARHDSRIWESAIWPQNACGGVLALRSNAKLKTAKRSKLDQTSRAAVDRGHTKGIACTNDSSFYVSNPDHDYHVTGGDQKSQEINNTSKIRVSYIRVTSVLYVSERCRIPSAR